MNNLTQKKNAQEIFVCLKKQFSIRSFLIFETPWQLLMATILSAQCTDNRVNQVTPSLFAFLPTPEKAMRVEPIAIEPYIRSVNYYHTKATYIHQNGEILFSQHSNQVPATMKELLTLRGVGRKTANVVLAQAFHKAEGIAVDTHVLRVSCRLGFTSALDTPVQAESVLKNLFFSSQWEAASILLIHLGRSFCKARKPDCCHCLVKNICGFEQKNRK